MRFKRRIGPDDGLKQMDITPLIDCVFLLLIFFMLTSNFVIVPGINVKLPKAVTSEEVTVKTVSVIITSENIIYVNDQIYSIEELKKFLGKKKIDSIFIKADHDASLGVVISIWDVCKQIGIEKIGIATTFTDENR